MDALMYLKCFSVAFCGFVFQLLLKYNSMRTKAIVGNHNDFSFKSFIKDDWPAILAGLVCIIICLFLIDEVLGLAPSVINKILILFTLVGYFNSDIMMRFLSVANRKLNEVINYKSDVADEKINQNL